MCILLEMGHSISRKMHPYNALIKKQNFGVEKYLSPRRPNQKPPKLADYLGKYAKEMKIYSGEQTKVENIVSLILIQLF